jgi:hypothetical protein
MLYRSPDKRKTDYFYGLQGNFSHLFYFVTLYIAHCRDDFFTVTILILILKTHIVQDFRGTFSPKNKYNRIPSRTYLDNSSTSEGYYEFGGSKTAGQLDGVCSEDQWETNQRACT